MSTKSSLPEAPSLLSQRLVSLDQFRGYTVAGMFLVNFLGKFAACPEILKHHNTYNSYADTIMPGFFFAVGFAFRLTFGRRAQEQGLSAAYMRVLRRFLGLALFAIFWYGHEGRDVADTWKGLIDIGAWHSISGPLKRSWFQTLLHIAVTGLWLTPVIRAGAFVRILYMIGSAALHLFLSYWFAFQWENHGGDVIDGGPLGFLTWTIPTMIGTLACDAVVNRPGRPPLVMMSFWAILLMLLGYGFSCGTRLYDLSPEEVAAQKQAMKERGATVIAKNEQIAALNKTLDEPNKQINTLTDELKKRKKEALNAKYEELRKSETAKNKSKTKLVDMAEESLKQNGYPDPRVAEIEAEIDRLKRDPRFQEVKGKVKQIQDELADLVDLKLADDPVRPRQSRIDAARARYEEQRAKAILAEPPFVPPPGDDKRIDEEPHVDYRLWNYWMMSQRTGTISYLTFAAGFNLLAYVLFYILGDMMGASVGVFRTFGMNALAGYIAHEWVSGLIMGYMPKDVPAWYMWTGFAVFFYITYLFIRTLEKQKIFLRL